VLLCCQWQLKWRAIQECIDQLKFDHLYWIQQKLNNTDRLIRHASSASCASQFIFLVYINLKLFGLKNAGEIYQWAMILAFYNLLGVIMLVYSDGIMIKLDSYLADLCFVVYLQQCSFSCLNVSFNGSRKARTSH
jgi:hypothetical protein